MIKVVLDTSIIVSGLRSRRGASNRLLVEMTRGVVRPVVTTPLFLEYESVLKRAEQRLVTGLSDVQIDAFLAAFASAAIGVETFYRWRPQLRDPADEMVLECVVNGEADVLVTHNIKDFGQTDKQFGYRLLTPSALLQEIPHD